MEDESTAASSIESPELDALVDNLVSGVLDTSAANMAELFQSIQQWKEEAKDTDKSTEAEVSDSSGDTTTITSTQLLANSSSDAVPLKSSTTQPSASLALNDIEELPETFQSKLIDVKGMNQSAKTDDTAGEFELAAETQSQECKKSPQATRDDRKPSSHVLSLLKKESVHLDRKYSNFSCIERTQSNSSRRVFSTKFQVPAKQSPSLKSGSLTPPRTKQGQRKSSVKEMDSPYAASNSYDKSRARRFSSSHRDMEAKPSYKTGSSDNAPTVRPLVDEDLLEADDMKTTPVPSVASIYSTFSCIEKSSEQPWCSSPAEDQTLVRGDFTDSDLLLGQDEATAEARCEQKATEETQTEQTDPISALDAGEEIFTNMCTAIASCAAESTIKEAWLKENFTLEAFTKFLNQTQNQGVETPKPAAKIPDELANKIMEKVSGIVEKNRQKLSSFAYPVAAYYVQATLEGRAKSGVAKDDMFAAFETQRKAENAAPEQTTSRNDGTRNESDAAILNPPCAANNKRLIENLNYLNSDSFASLLKNSTEQTDPISALDAGEEIFTNMCTAIAPCAAESTIKEVIASSEGWFTTPDKAWLKENFTLEAFTKFLTRHKTKATLEGRAKSGVAKDDMFAAFETQRKAENAAPEQTTSRNDGTRNESDAAILNPPCAANNKRLIENLNYLNSDSFASLLKEMKKTEARKNKQPLWLRLFGCSSGYSPSP
ncbi:hypothetical protein WMY93_022776 [Mugilogobius chulae]|uniref:Uncharacterized protein n=1 Tax=Mugilogobius chulae TaxID=88201 RepID=A0AAW0NC23_9GOBI